MSTTSSSFPNLDTPDRSHTPDYTRKTTRHLSEFDPDTTALWGLVLLLGTYIVFVVSMYAIVVSKLVPETGNKVKNRKINKKGHGWGLEAGQGFS